MAYTHEQLSAFGKLGGTIGGKIGGPLGGRRRAELLTREERSAIAKHANVCRWNKYRAKHGLPLAPAEPPPRVHRAPPKAPTNHMKTAFQYAGYSCEIHRSYDDKGHRRYTLFVDGQRFDYSWKEHQPLTPKQRAEAIADSMPVQIPIQAPVPAPPAERPGETRMSISKATSTQPEPKPVPYQDLDGTWWINFRDGTSKQVRAPVPDSD